MGASRMLARVTFGALIATALGFGAAQASASPDAAAPALACTAAETQACHDACVLRYNDEGVSSLCLKINGATECTCRP